MVLLLNRFPAFPEVAQRNLACLASYHRPMVSWRIPTLVMNYSLEWLGSKVCKTMFAKRCLPKAGSLRKVQMHAELWSANRQTPSHPSKVGTLTRFHFRPFWDANRSLMFPVILP